MIAILMTRGCVAGRCWAGCDSACAGGPGHDAGGRACSRGELLSRPCVNGLVNTRTAYLDPPENPVSASSVFSSVSKPLSMSDTRLVLMMASGYGTRP